jgi:hypothetical protein
LSCSSRSVLFSPRMVSTPLTSLMSRSFSSTREEMVTRHRFACASCSPARDSLTCAETLELV